MIYFGKIKEINAETLKEEDLRHIANTKIFTSEWGDLMLKFESDDPEYVDKWRKRTKATMVIGNKLKIRQCIEMQGTDDVRDRIADSFKFNTILLFMVSELYKLIDSSVMDENIKTLFDNFLETVNSAKTEIFNIDLKSSYLDTLIKLLDREKQVTNIIKEFNNGKDDFIFEPQNLEVLV